MPTITEHNTITDEMVDDILDAALQGECYVDHIVVHGTPTPRAGDREGERLAVSELLTRGVTLGIVRDDELEKEYTLTPEKMREGIRKEAARKDLTPLDFYENHDANSADNALQYALFGEIIFA